MKYLLLYICCIAALLTSSCKDGAVPPTQTCEIDFVDSSQNHPKAAIYQNILNTYVKKGLPGAVLYIRDDNGVWIGSAGKADIDKNINMAPCVVSKVASVTKMFVGTVAHLMAEEGKFDYDDPAAAYLPAEVVEKVANANCATIRQLMNHTSGIYDLTTNSKFYLEVLNNPDQTWDSDELIEFAYGQDANFACGQRADYSNTNTMLLGMVLSKIAGRPHHELVKEKILTPLNLQHVYYYSNVGLPANTAQGYFDLYNNGTIVNVSNYNTGSGNGYGGMYATVRDIAIFADALFRDKTLLKQATLDEMLTFNEEDPYIFLGLGAMKRFSYKGDTKFAYGHTGRDLGYSADCFYFPNQKTTMTFIVNYGTNAKSGLKQTFLDFEDAVITEITK
ncbi:MAG: beta-lactamase family protein [Bacteroidetes bacterium]|nr:MAG: beta-lactamase family protein [Bacteroidota bacterium]